MPLPSYDDFFATGIRAIQIRPSKFSKEIAEDPEATANTVMNIAASMMDETALVLDTSISENAFGPAMRMGGTVQDRLAFDRYGDDFEPRKTAAQAVVVLELRRTGQVGCVLLRGSRAASDDGQIFRTDNDVVFGPNIIGPLTVFATCTTAGPIGNVGAAKIRQLLDKPANDGSMTVDNPEPAAGGAPREDDGPFGGRIRGYWRSARKGTLGAVKYAAESVDGVSSVTVEEFSDPFGGKPAWRGRIIAGDLNGSANRALVAKIEKALPEARGLGVPVLVSGSVPVDVTITVVGLLFAANAQTSELLEQIRTSILAAVNSGAPGATLRISTITAAIEQYAPAVTVPQGAVTVPAGDLVPDSPSYSLRTRLDLITINGQ